MREINVFSAFDGMSCGQIALKGLDINVSEYYASEIDKFAIEQTQHNFPATTQLGDIRNIKAKDLPKIDLFLGGSPCQGFSFAGKQLAFDDPRSKLFFEFVRLWNEIKEINPDAKFLLENVNMKRNELRIISEYMGVFPVNINSNLVSAQNRNRWYWTNIRTKDVGLFSELWSDIPQPKDRKILLKDILQPENEIEDKYYIKNPKVGFEGLDINKKSNNLRSGGACTQSKKHNYDIIKVDKKLNKKSDQNKAGCLTGGGHSGGNHSDMDIICINTRKAEGTQSFQQNRIYSAKGKVPAICSTLANLKITNNYALRRLTPTECARLQTIPSWYKWIVSNSQIYKMLGNGWTVDVTKHILSFFVIKE